MLYLSSIVVILLGVICLWVSAEDPLTVSVGFSDGGFAAFQSKGNSPFYASASKDAFVINSSPDDTVVELSLPEYGKKSGTSSNPLVIAVLGLFFTATHFCLLFLTLFSFSRIGRSFPDGSAETVAKGVATHALHESFFKTSQANIEKLSIHNSDAPGTIVEDHAVVGGAMYIGGVQQWAQVAHDDFNTHGDGWFASTKDTPTPFSVSDKRQSCGNEADKHLGGYCYFGEVDVSKKYTDLPRHNFLRVTARVHFFDKWYGEFAYAKIDNNPVWQHSHIFCSKPFTSMCRGINTCGDDKYADKMSHKVSIMIPHTAPEFTLTFGAALGEKRACEASWGLDDVVIEVKH